MKKKKPEHRLRSPSTSRKSNNERDAPALGAVQVKTSADYLVFLVHGIACSHRTEIPKKAVYKTVLFRAYEFISSAHCRALVANVAH